MKQFFLFAGLAITTLAQAQIKDGKASVTSAAPLKEGKVIYEQTLQFQFRGNQQMPANLPKSQVLTYELLFGNHQSLLQMLPNTAEEANSFSGNGNSFRMMRGGDDVVYYNFETGKKTAQRELESKNYLVEDTIQKLPWKITDESKVILGYTVQKATAQNISKRMMMTMENGTMTRKEMPDTATIIAWFAPSIPVPAGPQFQGQLPGLILELDANRGRSVYKAIEISPKVNVSSIKEPKGGKRMAQADFEKENQKVMEAFRKRMADNGGRVNIQMIQQ